MAIELKLQQVSGQEPTASEGHPRLFNLARGEDREALDKLFSKGAVIFVHDTIREQLHELIAAREPARTLSEAERDARVRAQLNGSSLLTYGRWVYYPWSRRLVHVLPEPEYRALRSDRNQYKITPEEQARLRTFKIGIAGLSVGQAAAVTLTLEGIGGTFRLADSDALGLSNLNRLRAGVHNLGVNKAILAAREIFEIDPYLDIALFPDGISDDNLEAFLLEDGKLDLLIEECDDLYVKVRLREEARRLGIPVLMDTSDRGLIDIERFDREPSRPIFHGLVGSLQADMLKGLPTKEKVPFVLRILDETRISTAIAASLLEIQQTVSTWPQLASAVTLGGAVTTDVARRLLLGTFTDSGRFYVDLEALVGDGGGVALLEARADEDVIPSATRAPCRPIQRPSCPACGPITEDEIRYIVSHGILAPSGGNSQPWRFEWRDGRLVAYHDPGRCSALLDFDNGGTYVAFGAAAENMDLAAQDLGLNARIEPFPKPGNRLLVCAITFARCENPARPPELLDQVYLRVTNRRLSQRRPLDPVDRAAVEQAMQTPGARLQLLSDSRRLEHIGQILGEADRFRFLCQELHREMMREVRWTPSEVERTRDGLDLATLELSPVDRAGMRLIASWPVMAYVRRLGKGRALEQSARKAVTASTAVGLLTMNGVGPTSFFAGGRAVQRIWLRATARRLAFQPMTALPYLFARLERGGGEGLAEDERQALRELRTRYRELFEVPSGHAEIMLFRIAHAEAPTARSLRRRLDDVLSFT
jgi:nitroreductase